MNIESIRSKDDELLQKELLDLYKEQFNLRMQKGQSESTKPHQFKKIRRTIARIKTVISEKEAVQ